MNRKAAKIASSVGILILSILMPNPLRGQAVGTMSGTVTNSAGNVVINAKVSIKDVGTGQSTEIQTNSAGVYTAANLVPGDYTISVSAEQLSPKISKVTLTAAEEQRTDFVLSAEPSQQETPANKVANSTAAESGEFSCQQRKRSFAAGSWLIHCKFWEH